MKQLFGVIIESMWLCGMVVAQCELSNWVDVLDKLDDVLERCCTADSQWMLACDMPGHEADKHLLLTVLQFTALLVEQSFSRHLYSSMDHLTTLLSSSDMTVVLAVLDVLYMFRYALYCSCCVYIVVYLICSVFEGEKW